MSKKNFIILLLLISMIFIADISTPLLLPIICSALLICLLYKAEKRLLIILLVALWVRVIFAVGYNAYISNKSLSDHPERNLVMFGGDGEFQAGHAWWVYVLNLNKDLRSNDLMWQNGFFSDIWTYEELVLKNRYVPMNHYQVGYFSYLIAVLYSYFGYLPIVVNFINCILGTLTGYLFYRLALDLFHNKRIAYVALILVLCYPTLFIWSSLTKLKMPAIIFLIALFLLSNLRFLLRRKWAYLPLSLAAMLSMDLFREKFALVFAFIFLSYYLLIQRKNALVKILFIPIGCYIFSHLGKILYAIKTSLNFAMLIHQGTVNSGGIVYKLFDDKFYTQVIGYYPVTAIGYCLYYLKGIFHFVLEPLPQSIVTKNILLFYPQQIIWYFLLFFAFIGILYAWKYFRKEALVLIVYLAVIISMLSLSGGNIGTDVRHRDMISPVCFIFSSLGLVYVLGYKISDTHKET